MIVVTGKVGGADKSAPYQGPTIVVAGNATVQRVSTSMVPSVRRDNDIRRARRFRTRFPLLRE